jgi:hypothetical protein
MTFYAVHVRYEFSSFWSLSDAAVSSSLLLYYQKGDNNLTLEFNSLPSYQNQIEKYIDNKEIIYLGNSGRRY